MKDTTKTLEQIVRKLAALPDEQDVPLSWTRRQLDALQQDKRILEGRISTIRSASATLAGLPSIEADKEWRDYLAAWRAVLCDELEALPAHNKEIEHGLTFSIRLVDYGFGISVIGPIVDLSSLRIGQLMADAGYTTSGTGLRGPRGWRGSMPEVEQRIKELTQRRNEAQAQLDDALMDDDARAKAEAESAARRQILDELRLTGSDGRDGQPYHLVPHHADGSVIELSELTPEQRDVLDRANAAEAAREAARRAPVTA